MIDVGRVAWPRVLAAASLTYVSGCLLLWGGCLVGRVVVSCRGAMSAVGAVARLFLGNPPREQGTVMLDPRTGQSRWHSKDRFVDLALR